MTEATRITIAKLNNENYQIWKYKVQLLLIKEDFWDIVEQDPPAQLTADWTKKSNKARATICLLIEDNQIVHVRDCTTAKAAWDALKAYHEKSSLSSKVFLLKNVVNLRLQENGDMEEHLTALLNLVDKLTALGEKIVDSLLIAIILGSLPDSYSSLVTALESRSEEDLTLTLVKGKLIDEYKRRKSSKEEGETETAMKIRYSKNEAVCFFCKKPGHLKKDCFGYKRWKANKEKAARISEDKDSDEEESVHLCFSVRQESVISEHWYIDSGATSHMTGNKEFFIQMMPMDGSVKLANGKKAPIEGIGKGNVECFERDGKQSTFVLEDVFFVPSLEEGLISVRKLTKDGLQVTFRKDGCEIMKNGQPIAQSISTLGLYKLHQANVAIG